jgi:MoaA/NifB/PqqE/SkfB family radical SAM enzyme
MTLLDSLNGFALRTMMHRWLSIELTHKCNLNCKYCVYGDRNEEMPFEKAKEIIKEAHDLKFKYVSLSGGEPSLHPNFMEICDYIISLKMQLEIVTNGTNLKHHQIIHLNKFKKMRWALSIDSYDKEKNDALRGQGSFEGALRLWSSIKNSDSSFIILVTKDNLYDLPKTIHFVLEQLGAQNVTCFRAVPQGNAIGKNLLLNDEDIKFYVRTLVKLDLYYKNKGKNVAFGLGNCKAERCNVIDSWIMVMPDCKLHPCCYIPQLNYFKYEQYGDLKKFLETDYRTKINETIDKATVEGREKSTRKYGLSFCYNCIDDLRKRKVIE